MPIKIPNAQYRGGDPMSIEFMGRYGPLWAEDDGSFSFGEEAPELKSVLSGSTPRGNPWFTYEPGVILTVTMGDENQMRVLTRLAVGEAIAGDVGGLLGAMGGRENRELALIGEREGHRFVATFAVTTEDARAFIDILNRDRMMRGEPALPSAQEIFSVEATTPAEAPAGELGELVSLLREQNEILRAIAERLAR